MAKKLVTTIQQKVIQVDTAQIFITASVGLAEWEQGESFPNLPEKADYACYVAKSRG